MTAPLKRIMIVEDEPNVRLVFRAALASADHILSTAVDGESALRWLVQEPADLVLLDLQMPGIGGMETLRRMREAGLDTPVVIISAHDRSPNVVQAMRLGAIDFLPKPTTPAALRKVVADALSRPAPARTPSGPRTTPAASPAVDALAHAKAALGRRDFGRAEVALGRAIAADPRSAESHYLWGILHEIRDDRHAAYAAYRAALRADPDFEPASLHLIKYFPDRVL